MNVTRSRVALVADMDRLWAIGGYDGMKNLSTVRVTDRMPEKSCPFLNSEYLSTYSMKIEKYY